MSGQDILWTVVAVVVVGGICLIAYRIYSSRAAGSFEVNLDPKGGVTTKLSKAGQDDRAVVEDIKANNSRDSKVAARGEGSSVTKVDLKDSPGVTIEADTTKK